MCIVSIFVLPDRPFSFFLPLLKRKSSLSFHPFSPPNPTHVVLKKHLFMYHWARTTQKGREKKYESNKTARVREERL